MKGYTFFKGEINALTKLKKKILSHHWANVNQTSCKAFLGKGDSGWAMHFPRGDNNRIVKIHGRNLIKNFNSQIGDDDFFIIINLMCLLIVTFSQVSDVAHGPLVINISFLYFKRYNNSVLLGIRSPKLIMFLYSIIQICSLSWC